MRRAKLKEFELSEAIAIIESLNPRPGSSICPPSTSYVIPAAPSFPRKRESRKSKPCLKNNPPAAGKNNKKWTRKWKLTLIEKENPDWKDYHEDIV